MDMMKIPPHVPHIDCPRCVGGNLAKVLNVGMVTAPGCKTCKGEGVIRKDGKATLRTKAAR